MKKLQSIIAIFAMFFCLGNAYADNPLTDRARWYDTPNDTTDVNYNDCFDNEGTDAARVDFVNDRAKLTPECEQRVINWAKQVPMQQCTQFNIIARTDSTGKDDYNIGLSNARRKYVIDLLTQVVNGSVLGKDFIAGEANSRRLNGNNAMVGAERRVDIIVQNNCYTCDNKKLTELKEKCTDEKVNAKIDSLIAMCDDNNLVHADKYTEYQNALDDLIEVAALGKCKDIVQQTVGNREIENLVAEIDGIFKSYDKSHWKNADGGFNTSRLVSDSVAGVVLGTVGGVITSKIVKKNQIKGGFEDIQCTIGGQVVADWGDEFNVGLQ